MDSTDKKGGCDKHGSCPRCRCRLDKKLHVFDWLEDIPESHEDTDFVEVQFKNTRKGYYRNSNKLPIEKGDIVAVESNPGHDIGEVTLTGRLVLLQMKKNNVRTDNPDIKRIYRKAKPTDLEKYEEAKAREHDTMLRSRKIAEDLHLNMKIGDVEYQGDGNKAIFYYIADDRVDFRQLIKVLAETFRVRIEMKQIGARQEAGRIGGIGPCGRELCCSSWMTGFVSVATSAARYQDISLNPQKLAGQCAKLKCCLNYEVDTYVEAQKKLPSREVVLETKDGQYFHFKTDIHRRMICYSTSKDVPANLVTISAARAFEIIALNRRGVKVDKLEGETKEEEQKKDFQDVVGQDSLTRFDKNKKKGDKKKKKGGANGAAAAPDAAAGNRSSEASSGNRGSEANSGNRGSEGNSSNRNADAASNNRRDRQGDGKRRERPNREKKQGGQAAPTDNAAPGNAPSDNAATSGNTPSGEAQKGQPKQQRQRQERQERQERGERPQNGERQPSEQANAQGNGERPERGDRPDRGDRNNRRNKQRPQRNNRGERPANGNGGERPANNGNGGERPANSNGGERPANGNGGESNRPQQNNNPTNSNNDKPKQQNPNAD
jgi:cell fate regulator YaaT (PSP1 superfamily)